MTTGWRDASGNGRDAVADAAESAPVVAAGMVDVGGPAVVTATGDLVGVEGELRSRHIPALCGCAHCDARFEGDRREGS